MSELTISTLEKSLSTTQTMSAPNPATPPKNGACIWWTLPKEVSDKALEFAYGTPDKPISILDEPAFECLQMDKEFDWDDEEKSFEPRKYKRYIDRLLVSKKWHREAVDALFASTPVSIHEDDSTFLNLNPLISLEHQRPLLALSLITFVHIASLDKAPEFARLLATQCPRLRRLHATDKACSAPFLSACWTTSAYVDIWQGRWTEKGIMDSAWFAGMRLLSGLSSVSLVVGEDDSCPPLFQHLPWEMEVLRANVRLAERLFAKSATRPGDPAALLEAPVRKRRVPCHW